MLLGWYGYLSLISFILWDTLQSIQIYDEKVDEPNLQSILSSSLKGRCIETDVDEFNTNFVVCFKNGVLLNQFTSREVALPTETNIWKYEGEKDASLSEQRYVKSHHCEDENGNVFNESKVIIRMECCRNFLNHQSHHYFMTPSARKGEDMSYTESVMDNKIDDLMVREVINSGCETYITVCSTLICKSNNTSSQSFSWQAFSGTQRGSHGNSNSKTVTSATKQEAWQFGNLSPKEQREQLEKVYDVFHHAYQSYMTHAFPKGELRPISCEGGNFDLIKIPLVTLIDTLDTLVVVHDHEEFRRAVALLVEHLPRGFDFDVNVSVFETTIRLVGGLLSAHLFAIDPLLEIYSLYRPRIPHYLNPTEIGSTFDRESLFDHPRITKDSVEYHDELLVLAIDIGNRLMPAFYTKTGIPYGTVNLKHGVPKGETRISSTAGSGSLFVEFHVLSVLAHDDKYGYAAYKAIKALFDRRSSLDLVGKHINIDSGQWQETMSGVGSNSDSFYEYHLKAYALLHGAKPMYKYYDQLYKAVKHYILPDDAWFTEVDMFTGRFARHRIENLDAFWPGLEVAMGEMSSSSKQLQALYGIWLDLGFLPEELDLASWRSGKGPSNPLYPLRPELIEATVYHYQATKDRSWLSAGQLILESIQNYTRTGCGFASVANIMSIELSDEMPSFFLSETVKYLYLLFDEDHFLHQRSVIYSTEAHPFDLVQLRQIEKAHVAEYSSQGYSVYREDMLPHEDIFVLRRPQSGTDDMDAKEELDETPSKRKALNTNQRVQTGTKISHRKVQQKHQQKPRRNINKPTSSRTTTTTTTTTSSSVKYNSRKMQNAVTVVDEENAEHQQGEEDATPSVETSPQDNALSLVCTVVKWWDLPRSFRWTTEDPVTSGSSSSSSSNGHSSKHSKRANTLPTKATTTTSYRQFFQQVQQQQQQNGDDVEIVEWKRQHRADRQLQSLRLLQQLVVQYYDVYGVKREDRPAEVRHLMKFLDDNSMGSSSSTSDSETAAGDSGDDNDAATAAATSAKTSSKGKEKKTASATTTATTRTRKKASSRLEKCALTEEEEASSDASMQSVEQQLLNLQDNLGGLQSKLQEFAKKHLAAGPGAGVASGEEKPLKSVELALGNLGNFGVQVFADAFRITNQQDLLTLDIANVGRKSIFVRQFTPVVPVKNSGTSNEKKNTPIQYNVQAVAANHKGYFSTCFVELIERDESSYDTANVLLRLPCATSTFSRNRPRVVEADLSVPSAEYDSFLCRKSINIPTTTNNSKKTTSTSTTTTSSASAASVGKEESSAAAAEESHDQTSNKRSKTSSSSSRTALDDIVSLRQWFRNRFIAATTTTAASTAAVVVDSTTGGGRNNEVNQRHHSTAHDHSSQTSAVHPASELSGTIVLAERGQCLFEDKAELAIRAGALGLIMKNQENTLFMMAGKKEADLLATQQSTAGGDAQQVHGTESIDLPVVMLTDVHATQLMTTFRQYHNHNNQNHNAEQEDTAEDNHEYNSNNIYSKVLKVRIVIEDASSVLLSPVLLGPSPAAPMVWSTKQSIFVQTQARWGAFFQVKEVAAAATSGTQQQQQQQQQPPQPQQQDWQMYLVDLKDHQAHKLIPPTHFKTMNGHKVSTQTATLMMTPGHLYRHLIRRSCPSDLISVNPQNQRDVRLHRKLHLTN